MTSFGPKLDASARLCCIIGDPVSHSLSPTMQNAAFRALGLSIVYVAFRVTKDELGRAVHGLRSLGFLGGNITIPYKVSIIDLIDEVDPKASQVGAVNTVVNRDGRIIGTNTDVDGILNPLEKRRVDLKGSKAVLLGTGGAARACIAALSLLSVRECSIHGRTPSKALALAEKARGLGIAGNAHGINPGELRAELKTSSILINATPVGMHPDIDGSLVPEGFLQKGMVVFDLVYNPLKTVLISRAEKEGAMPIPGHEMLVEQGAASFKIWTGLEPPIREMAKTVLDELGVMGG